MKILVVITGGTIGSTIKGSFTSLDTGKNYTLIEQYKSKHGDSVDFKTVSPYSILSENLGAEELNKLIDYIDSNINGGYDGIVVTHGTDTLQYSAAALAYCYPAASVPVVLVSANHPLDNTLSNGHDNFEAAVEFIRAKAGNGVFVAYKNKTDSKTDIHYGTRIYTHLENKDEVYSIDNRIFASYENGTVVLNSAYAPTTALQKNTPYHFRYKTGVMVVSSMPGDSFAYDLSEAKAVIIRPYHSGTINTADGCLQSFCEKAKESCVPVFIMTAGLKAEYESTSVFKRYGIIPLPLSTFVSQFVKLWIANSNDFDVTEFMKGEIAHEYINEN